MKKLIILSAVAVGVYSLPAAEPFFQASLTPDIAIHSKTTQIDGICLSIWGENPQHAFALGFVNGSTGDSIGFSLGLVNYAEGYTGFSYGLVNISSRYFSGVQMGYVNVSSGTFVGVQDGWVNIAEDFTGLQYGLINYAKNLRGVQMGIVNIARNNPWFKEFPDKLATGFPIVNWSF